MAEKLIPIVWGSVLQHNGTAPMMEILNQFFTRCFLKITYKSDIDLRIECIRSHSTLILKSDWPITTRFRTCILYSLVGIQSYLTHQRARKPH